MKLDGSRSAAACNRDTAIAAFTKSRRVQDLLLDVAQPILAEEDFLADEKGRAAERAARNRVLRIPQQAVLHRRFLRASEQARGVEPGLLERAAHHLRVVHLLRLG